MTELERLKLRIPEATEAELQDSIESARDVILSRCFFDYSKESSDEVARALCVHQEKIIDAATVIYNMRGAEGQTSHSENGVARSFEENAGLKSILSRIVPKGRVL